MRLLTNTRARRSLALAAAVSASVTSFGLASMPDSASAATRVVADDNPQRGATTGGTAETVSHITGQDQATGEAISATTVEVDGAPVVTGTADDGTDASRTGSNAARAEFSELTNALAEGETPGVDNALDGSASRLGSANVYDTAVAISQRAWKTGSARTVYITRADRTTDALAAGALKDGPVLFVPRTGVAPSNVVNEIKRLAPRSVVALGGESAVSSGVLKSAGAGRSTSRIAGANSYQTATAIARRAFPNGAPEVYLAGLKQGRGGAVQDSPDAAAGGVLSKGPVLPVPTGAAVPAEIKTTVGRMAPSKVYALGGTSAVAATSLKQAAGSRGTARLGGADRYATSAAIAKHAFPKGAKVAYLAAGNDVAEAVAGGTLSDGPILFAPPTGRAYNKQLGSVAGALDTLRVRAVGAISSASDLPASAVDAVVAKSTSVNPGPLPAYAPVGAPATTRASASAPAQQKAKAPETCDSLVESFRPIALPSMYTISCADSIEGNANVLGLTTSRIYVNSGVVASGEVVINRNQPISMMKATIAHEIAHAYSYGHLSKNQRNWFTGELMKVDRNVTSPEFGGSDYDHMPAEQWARGQATCEGWPDPFDRPTARCSLIDATIANKI